MASDEALRREIIELIDKHWNNWIKAAFYSDPEVSKIMNRIIQEWRENGERGAPIDYATRDELLVLVKAARRYYMMDPRRAMATAMANMSRDGEEDDESNNIFKKLFSRGRREASP